MEVIGIILMIIFALVSASDKKKKAAKQAQQRTGMNVPPRPAAAAKKPAAQLSMAEREARLEQLRRQQADRAAQKAAAASAAPVMPSNAKASFESSLTQLKELLEVATQANSGEGESMLADADCAGGSMPHRHTEGVSRATQSRRLQELDSRLKAEEADGLIPAAIDARALRRAVVMAEVLGKPKALKRA